MGGEKIIRYQRIVTLFIRYLLSQMCFPVDYFHRVRVTVISYHIFVVFFLNTDIAIVIC